MTLVTWASCRIAAGHADTCVSASDVEPLGAHGRDLTADPER
jgi:hypothetical protein